MHDARPQRRHSSPYMTASKDVAQDSAELGESGAESLTFVVAAFTREGPSQNVTRLRRHPDPQRVIRR